MGTVTSLGATLSVLGFTTNLPATTTGLVSGASKVLSVAATGVPAPTYQWRKNGVNITGATLPYYTALAGTVEGTNAYDVVITNATGTATSATATIATSVQVTVASAPAARNVVAGQAASFSVTPAGTGPFTYQWLKNGVVIVGATNSTYDIAAASPADVATYSVKVTGPVGTVTSLGATLSVIAPFTISAQPMGGLSSVNVSSGGSTTLSVTAAGIGPFTYQWRKNAVNIAGATLASFVAWAGAVEGSASYDVVITGPVSSLASNAVRITTCIPVLISQQPVAVVRAVGQPASFFVSSTGTAPLSYQWMKNGVNIVGATGVSYSIASTVAGDAASYSVKVSGPVGSATSSSVTLSLHVPPSVSTQPVNAYKALGQSAAFSVVVLGTGPFTYQWSKDGNAIAGANAATYSIAVVGNTDVGRYSVSVANAVGAVLSQEAELAIVTAPSILIQPTAVNAVTAQATRSYRAKYYGFNNSADGWSAVPWSGKDLEWPATGWYWNDQIDEGLAESNLEGAAGGGATVSPLISLVGLTSPQLRFRVGTAGAFTIHISTDKTNWTPLFNIPAGAVTSNDPISVSLAAFAGSSCYLRITSTSGTWLDEVEIWGTGLAKEIVELSVATQGEGLTYQWYKDGVAITGATSRGYVIADATVSTTAGSYAVKVSNAAGSVTSSAAKVGILPLVSAQPASVYKAVGQPASFSVSVSGVGPFTYQWQRDGVPIAGATASVYSIASVGVASAGSYAVSVSNAVGGVLSQSASLQIVASPVISTQPASQGYVAKIPQTYRVRYFGFGSGPDGWSVSTTDAAFHQNWGQPGWYWNPYLDEIPANPLAANLEGGFGGVVTSPWISLVGVTNPEVRFICMSSSGTLSIQTSSDGTNWVTVFTKTNDSAMASYTVSLAAYAGTGCYIRATTTAACDAYLDEVEVWGYGTPSNFATFTISASGGGLSYQWYKDGGVITGATASTYSVADVYATGAVGLYSVRVTNAAGTTASTAATLAIIPAITTQPIALIKVAGQPAVFSVVATGTGPLTYQWYKTGVQIAGATAASYSIPAVSAQHIGNYCVTISNALGQVTSQSVGLSVTLPPAITTQPSSYVVPAETKALNTVVKYDFNMGEQGWVFGSNAANAAATAWFFGWDDPTQVDGLVECDNFSGQYADLYARSPWISLAGVDLPSLSFTADYYGSSGSLSVEASKDGVSWVALKDPLPAYGSYDYASSYLADLSDYVLTGVYLRVRLRGTNFAGVIDNWEVKGYKYPSGQSRVLSVTATGSGNSFQWFRNGLAIAGATSSSYAITDCYAAASLGSYTVTVSNAAGAVTSAAAVVSVALPAITSQPQSYSGSWPSSSPEVTLSNGFTLGAEGWGPVGVGYPGWMWNDQRFEAPTVPTASSLEGNGYIKSPLVSLSGVTGASVSFDIQAYGGILTLDASTDGVTWSNLYSFNSATTSGGTKTVSLSVYNGRNVYLRFYMPATGAALLDNVKVSGYSRAYTMTAAVSGIGCSYQWYKNGVAISGATASSYRVADIALATSAGSYTVRVANAAGTVTSNAAVVPAFAAPVITSQPSSLSVLGSTYVPYTVKNYTFTSGAEGWTYGSNYGNQAAYHWDWDSTAGAISDRLFGSYYASYTDTYTQSPWISLLGVSSPVLYFTAYHDLYPDSLDVLEVQASSDGVYWTTLRSIYGNGSGVYSVSLASYQWAGCYLRYRLRSSPLYNAWGILIHDTVVSGTVVSLGGSAGFSVGLSSSAGCTFQWYKDNVAISGANSSSYYIANAYASDAGVYKVVVTNPVGSVTSASATLTVR